MIISMERKYALRNISIMLKESMKLKGLKALKMIAELFAKADVLLWEFVPLSLMWPASSQLTLLLFRACHLDRRQEC